MKLFDHEDIRKNEYLMELVSIGNVAAVRELLAMESCDLNYVNAYGEYPVHIAARRNSLRMMTLLIEHGAAVDVEDAFRRTPMMWAVHNRSTEMQALIEAKLGNTPDSVPG